MHELTNCGNFYYIYFIKYKIIKFSKKNVIGNVNNQNV